MRGRAIDAATRESLLTPEEREARRLAEEERNREFEEARASRRMLINAEFDRAYRTYTTTTYDTAGVVFHDRMTLDSSGNLFYDTPAVRQPFALATPTLNEQLLEAQRQASQCAQRGDARGQLMAIHEARRLRARIQLIKIGRAHV